MKFLSILFRKPLLNLEIKLLCNSSASSLFIGFIRQYRCTLKNTIMETLPTCRGLDANEGDNRFQKVKLIKNEEAALEDLSKEQLIAKVGQLERHVQQLRNIIARNSSPTKEISRKKRKKEKELDFRRYKKRHIALKLLYLGWDYHGLSGQEDIAKTIEECLFTALKRTKLVESRETCNYSRCGRTDKGVSALSQVISLDLRTNLLEGDGIITPENYIPQTTEKNMKEELPFSLILNRVLPPEIRVVAVASVPHDFSARYDCIERTYKYFFPKGDLNIEVMKNAGQQLVGVHDFRNFCKMSVANGVINYIREVCSLNISELTSSSDGSYQLCELSLVGKSFLWHQVRCIVRVLFLIGQGKESSEVILQLLDIVNCPRKPQYDMASDYPLILFDAQYEKIEWQYDQTALKCLIAHLQKLWTEHAVKTAMIKSMIDVLNGSFESPNSIINHTESLMPGGKTRIYKPLMKRPLCESLEEKIENVLKKGRMTFATRENTEIMDHSSASSDMECNSLQEEVCIKE